MGELRNDPGIGAFRASLRAAKERMDADRAPLDALHETLDDDAWQNRLAVHPSDPFGQSYDELLKAFLLTDSVEGLQRKCDGYVYEDRRDMMIASNDTVRERLKACREMCEAAERDPNVLVAAAKNLFHEAQEELRKGEREAEEARQKEWADSATDNFARAMEALRQTVMICKRCENAVADAIKVAERSERERLETTTAQKRTLAIAVLNFAFGSGFTTALLWFLREMFGFFR